MNSIADINTNEFLNLDLVDLVSCFQNIRILTDDGYSGTNFERPGIQEALSLVEQGLVENFIVKDMSRFGRDYLQVGHYTALIFPSRDVRFIAVNDGVDRNHWIPDEDTAPVVRRIFDLTLAGKGPSQIARILEQDKVLTTKALYSRQQERPLPERPYHWAEQSVEAILERIEYTGCVCNFKTHSKSYKLKKRIPNAAEDMFILPDTQEAIIKNGTGRRNSGNADEDRSKLNGREYFQGLCTALTAAADSILPPAKTQTAARITTSAPGIKAAGDLHAHCIREDGLRKVVLEHIRAVTAHVRSDVESFQEKWFQCQRTDHENSVRSDKQKLAQAKKRLAEIDVLISQLYENMELGTLSKDRYQKMSQGYEAEQAELNNAIISLEDWIETREDKNDSLNQFLALVRKYVEIPELTTTIANELIRKIIVYAPNKLNGKQIPQVKIIFIF